MILTCSNYAAGAATGPLYSDSSRIQGWICEPNQHPSFNLAYILHSKIKKKEAPHEDILIP